jgi:hypothetical protein
MGNAIQWGRRTENGPAGSNPVDGASARPVGGRPAPDAQIQAPVRPGRIGQPALGGGPALALAPPARLAAAGPAAASRNDVSLMSAGTRLFRGDDQYQPSRRGAYRSQFFLMDETKTSIYGELKLEFTLKHSVTLLRLDQNVEEFRQWLAEHRPDGLAILHDNYGYPREGDERQPRLRHSVADQDRTMLACIRQYSEARRAEGQQGYDGYRTEPMTSVDLARGDFHGEIGLCNGALVSLPTLLSGQPDEEINYRNQSAVLSNHTDQLRRKRAERRARNDEQTDDERAPKRLRFDSPSRASPGPWAAPRRSEG